MVIKEESRIKDWVKRMRGILNGCFVLMSLFCLGWIVAPWSAGCGGPECKFDADCTRTGGRCVGGKCEVSEKTTPDGGPKPDENTQECQNGFVRKCYTGPENTQNIGVCKAGSQTCTDGKWGTCEGEVKPTTEVCDNNLDDDCDGMIDEGCDCDPPGRARACYRGDAETQKNLPCQAGEQRCLDTKKWSDQCVGMVLPRKETCNGIDDDCDGQIDNECPCKPGATSKCYISFTETAGKGRCKEGVMTCRENGQWGTCEGALGPLPKEICNGEDDDCNGKVDEGCQCKPGESQDCYTGPDGTLGKGICKKGRQSCNEQGKWGECLGQINPAQEEVCNGLDDNCDGQVDEGLQRPLCALQKGICGGTRQKCGGEKGWLPCTTIDYETVAPAYEENEKTCDNLDNDCDGQIDEQLIRPCYTSNAGCQQDSQGFQCEGSCKAGLQTCTAGHWSACVGEQLPGQETCNGVDDDCDGIIDNGCQCNPGQQQSCYSGPVGTADKGECKKGTQTCLTGGKWGACLGDVKPQTETCNNKDDNCDGQVDEGLSYSCYTGPANTANVGECKKGEILCQNGQFTTCQNQVLPATEKCNNQKDDDCDGQIDETDGRALSFAGSAQHVEINHHNSLNLTGSFTIELWFYLDALSSRNIALLLNKHRSGDDTNGYHIKVQHENTPSPECGFSWWNQNGGNQLLFGPCPLKQWTHIALVYDSPSKSYRFYLNGIITKQGSQEISIQSNNYSVLFGTESNATDDVHFRGQLASVRMSNAARYTTGFTPTCTFTTESVTIGLWNLEDGSGPSVRDSSPGQHHGKINGPTWTSGRTCNAAPYGGCTP